MPLTPLQVLNKVVESRVETLHLTGYRTLANLVARGRTRNYRKTAIDWDARNGGMAATWEAASDNSSNNTVGEILPAQLRIGQYRLKHQFPISKIAIQEAASVAPEELADLFGAYTDDAIVALTRTLNATLFSGDGSATSGGVTGFAKIADNTAAYAGIDPATKPLWKAQVNANGGTARALTRNLLLAVDESADTNEAPYDMIVASPAILTSYTKVFDAITGNPAVILPPQDNRSLPTVDLGQGVRQYNGIPIISDPQATAGTIMFLDSSKVNVLFFELSNNPSAVGFQQHVVNRSYGMPIHITEIPSQNSAVRVFEFSIYPQLWVKNRKALTWLTDLN